MTNNILEIHNLSKDYGDFVLDRVSFSLPRGVIMGLIGENGAGKSTTINCILNEIQKDSGGILIFGKDHISDEIEIKSKLGVVFDENHFLSCVSFFAENSLKAAVSASASRPLKKTR